MTDDNDRIADLKMYFDQRFTDMERHVDSHVDALKDMARVVSEASKDAVKVAADSSVKLFDTAATSSGKAIDAALVSINSTIAAFQDATKEHFKTINGLQLKLDRQAENFATKEDLQTLRERVIVTEAMAAGSGAAWIKIAAVLGSVLSLVAVGIQVFVTLPKVG